MNRKSITSLHLALSTVIALPLAFGSSGCELVSSVDRSQINGVAGFGNGGASESGGSASGGSSGTSAGEAGSDAGGEAGTTESEAGAAGDAGASGSGTANGGSTQSTGGNGGSSGLGGTSGGGAGGKVIYLTSTPKKANFGGVVGADALCNASPPSAGTYKALLVDGSTRVACTSANCATNGAAEGVDWVLAPSTKYVRADGSTVIGTTTAAAVFAFPLTASIGTTGFSYWTGLNADWTTTDGSCTGWTQTNGAFANEGLADTTDSQAITGVSESCASLAGAFFACVQQ